MITIRPATVEDADGIGRVSAETWLATYRGLMPDHILDNVSVAGRAARYREILAGAAGQRATFVAVDDGGRVVGFAACGPARVEPPPAPPDGGVQGRTGHSEVGLPRPSSIPLSPFLPPHVGEEGGVERSEAGVGGGRTAAGGMGYSGELYALYVLPAWHGQGVGRRLVAAVVAHLRGDGHQAMYVWVLAGNPACGFYQRLGGQFFGVKDLPAGDATLVEEGYGFTFDAMRL